MASNSFGRIFKFTTWGESHGKAIGAVIDGCPAGIEFDCRFIQEELLKRSPGKSPFTSPRKEQDSVEILSGIFEGKTTGAPISMIIKNLDADSESYNPIKDVLRPGHANYTYLEKYGIFDYRGGGRASARETAARVAAGAVAKKFLEASGIRVYAYIKQIGPVKISLQVEEIIKNLRLIAESPLFCPDKEVEKKMIKVLNEALQEGDSLGGIVEMVGINIPPGLGDPVYQKIESALASAMLSIPACKGFEIGAGFASAEMKGSEHNDLFILKDGSVQTATNHAGGSLGGITSGMPLVCRAAFKPTSSIKKEQASLTVSKQPLSLKLPASSRHDPCVAIRASAVVAAMGALVLADALLASRLCKN